MNKQLIATVVCTLCALSILPAKGNELLEATEQDPAAPFGEDPVGTFWELAAEQKRGTFLIRTYQPNLVLPFHYTTQINNNVSSPTRGKASVTTNQQTTEMKIAISLRAKMLENFLLRGGDVWVAYTQTSLWQAYNRSESSPFRSTDHNPEVFYSVPVAPAFDIIPGSGRLRLARAGMAHESNGQSKPESRSRNYISFGGVVEFSRLIWETTWKQRIDEASHRDDNPDYVNYAGNFENRFSTNWNATTVSITRVSPYLSLNRGSWQLDMTHPVSPSNPEGLRISLQIFSGYGESMLDYNHRQTRIGIGFVLFNI